MTTGGRWMRVASTASQPPLLSPVASRPKALAAANGRTDAHCAPPKFVGAPVPLARNPLNAPVVELLQQSTCLLPKRLQRRMLRLPLAFDLPHHEGRIALHHHIPRAVLERQTQSEYQRLVLSDVVGSLVVT